MGDKKLPTEFEESTVYLSHCITGWLVDLVSCMNFPFHHCCAWHAGTSRLKESLGELERHHSCSDGWKPPAQWQCSVCSALMDDNVLADECWICGSQAHHTLLLASANTT